MGSYDGAETCELVGSFPLPTTETQHQHRTLQIRRTGHFKHHTKRHRKHQKEICCIFNHNGLRITIEANKQTINFLDVTFNLNENTYQPFTKPNTTLQYVHRGSNHHKEHTRRHQQKTVIPFIWQSILQPSRSSIQKSTRRMRIPVHSTLRTTHD